MITPTDREIVKRLIDEFDACATGVCLENCESKAAALRRLLAGTTPTWQPAIQSVLEERRRQDAQWGGPEHDDAHDIEDWFVFIDRQLDAARELIGNLDGSDADLRARFVKIAALAVAACEVMDRAHPEAISAGPSAPETP